MPLIILSEPASVAWCTETPGVKAIELLLTSELVDTSLATAARIKYSVTRAAPFTVWSCSLTTTGNTGEIKARHLFGTGDLSSALFPSIELRPFVTVGGVEFPCDPCRLMVIP